jgi:protein O-mannosyl-transferase
MTPAPTDDLRTSRFPIIIISAFIFILTMMTYVNAVNADFVNWDDDTYITENPLVRSLSPASIAQIFSTTHFYAWIPLTLLSHAIDVAVWGMNPKGHHLTSLLLHSTNAVMLFLACLMLLKSLKHRTAETKGEVTSILVGSMIAALLFAMHPLRVESVAWVSGRKDLLCTFFLLPSLYTFIKWKPKKRGWLLALSVVLFACALLSKSTAVVFPVILLLFDLLVLHQNDQATSLRNSLTDKIPYFILSGVVGMVTMMATQGGQVNVIGELSSIDRMLLLPYMFSFYLWRTLLPISLSPVYPELDSIVLALSPAVALATLAILWMSIKRRRAAVILAILSYLLFLLPVFAGLSSGLQPLADRYSYIAVISIFMLIAGGIEWLWRTSASSGAKKYRRRTLFAVLICVCAVSCYRTIRHLAVWDNSVALWTQAARYVPATRDQYERRRPYMKPNHLDALTNLGTAYYAEGNKEEAYRQFRRILMLDEHSADAHYNIGNLLYEEGDVDGSVVSFEKAIAYDSLYAKAYFNIGIIAANKGDSERALQVLRRAAGLGFPDAQHLLQQQGIGW